MVEHISDHRASRLISAGAATGPRRGAALGVQILRDGNLLFTARQVRTRGIGRTACAVPGGDVELQAAVVTISGVDRPVVGGLAIGDSVPVDAA